jgi:hypothetical protein
VRVGRDAGILLVAGLRSALLACRMRPALAASVLVLFLLQFLVAGPARAGPFAFAIVA